MVQTTVLQCPGRTQPFVNVQPPPINVTAIPTVESDYYAIGLLGFNTNTGVFYINAGQKFGWQTLATSTSVLVSNLIVNTSGTAPAAGTLGQSISSSVVVGSAAPLTTATPLTIASIALTPGVWDVSAIGAMTGAATGTIFTTGITTTTNSLTGSVPGDTQVSTPTLSTAASDSAESIPSARKLVTANTTYYLVISATFTVGTPAGYGRISAVRVA